MLDMNGMPMYPTSYYPKGFTDIRAYRYSDIPTRHAEELMYLLKIRNVNKGYVYNIADNLMIYTYILDGSTECGWRLKTISGDSYRGYPVYRAEFVDEAMSSRSMGIMDRIRPIESPREEVKSKKVSKQIRHQFLRKKLQERLTIK